MSSIIEKCKSMLSQRCVDVDMLSESSINIIVALIEGHNVVSDSISDNLVPCSFYVAKHSFPIEVFPNGKSLTGFCAVENDQLAFLLMRRHGIKVSQSSDGSYVGMLSHCRGEEDIKPNKAICKAIISKYLTEQ